MKVVCELDDFSILRSRMDLLLELKSHFPKFKVSLFTIPFDYEYEMGTMRTLRPQRLKEIHTNMGWMEFIPHGAMHLPREFEHADRAFMDTFIENIEKEFAKDGLPMVKGFKPPYWLWNQDVVDSLDAHGWWGAVNRDEPNPIVPKRFYKYTHSIHEPGFWHVRQEVLKLHGHMTAPSANNLEDCIVNLLKLPADVDWCFASEFVEEK